MLAGPLIASGPGYLVKQSGPKVIDTLQLFCFWDRWHIDCMDDPRSRNFVKLKASAVHITGEEDDFIREAAFDSVRVHPLSLFR